MIVMITGVTIQKEETIESVCVIGFVGLQYVHISMRRVQKMLNRKALLTRVEGSLFACLAALDQIGMSSTQRANTVAAITNTHHQIIDYIKESMVDIPQEYDYNPAALVKAEAILKSREAHQKCVKAGICPFCTYKLKFVDGSDFRSVQCTICDKTFATIR